MNRLLQDVLRLHYLSILHFGGVQGIRDIGLLQSAVARPFQTFDETELYKSPIEKAAALLESMAKNHPFIDGNKRAAFLAMSWLLHCEGYQLIASEEDAYELVIKTSTNACGFNEIVEWITSNVSML